MCDPDTEQERYEWCGHVNQRDSEVECHQPCPVKWSSQPLNSMLPPCMMEDSPYHMWSHANRSGDIQDAAKKIVTLLQETLDKQLAQMNQL